MKILVINAGSSSLKFKLFEHKDEKVLASGQFKNHAKDEYSIKYKVLNKEERALKLNERDYKYAFDYIGNLLNEEGIITSEQQVTAIIHRIVHGGEEFIKPAELNDTNIKKIEVFNEFAPLHNPIALEKVNNSKKVFHKSKQFGVFDTSFHLTMEKEDFLYGLPYGYYENLGVRRFGFHGSSHEFITNELKKKKKKFKLVSCHLGSGSSVCAVKDGIAIDNSFGFSPEENLIMATRSGEIDFDAVIFLKEKLMMNDKEITDTLNNDSGLLGISGYTKDMKVLIDDYDKNPRAKLAVDMYVSKVVEFIAKFYVKLEGIDNLVFTGGIGQGSFVLRDLICKKLKIIGIEIDKKKNDGAFNVENKG
ncbi:MAG: acetate/propionate family kinase [Candidatus Dojkabacteria bacterium]|nr:acetate/propionate family kinase [Candidatus Dojkabacteria bacterium]